MDEQTKPSETQMQAIGYTEQKWAALIRIHDDNPVEARKTFDKITTMRSTE